MILSLLNLFWEHYISGLDVYEPFVSSLLLKHGDYHLKLGQWVGSPKQCFHLHVPPRTAKTAQHLWRVGRLAGFHVVSDKGLNSQSRRISAERQTAAEIAGEGVGSGSESTQKRLNNLLLQHISATDSQPNPQQAEPACNRKQQFPHNRVLRPQLQLADLEAEEAAFRQAESHNLCIKRQKDQNLWFG